MPRWNKERQTAEKALSWRLLEGVGAVRAQADDVLEEDLVIRLAHARVVARELQTHAAELAWVPVDHRRVALRLVVGEDREVGRRERARIDQADAGGTRIQLVVAVAD